MESFPRTPSPKGSRKTLSNNSQMISMSSGKPCLGESAQLQVIVPGDDINHNVELEELGTTETATSAQDEVGVAEDASMSKQYYVERGFPTSLLSAETQAPVELLGRDSISVQDGRTYTKFTSDSEQQTKTPQNNGSTTHISANPFACGNGEGSCCTSQNNAVEVSLEDDVDTDSSYSSNESGGYEYSCNIRCHTGNGREPVDTCVLLDTGSDLNLISRLLAIEAGAKIRPIPEKDIKEYRGFVGKEPQSLKPTTYVKLDLKIDHYDETFTKQTMSFENVKLDVMSEDEGQLIGLIIGGKRISKTDLLAKLGPCRPKYSTKPAKDSFNIRVLKKSKRKSQKGNEARYKEIDEQQRGKDEAESLQIAEMQNEASSTDWSSEQSTANTHDSSSNQRTGITTPSSNSFHYSIKDK